MRPRVTVRVETNVGGEMLHSYVTALLEPLVDTCDVYIQAVHVRAPLLGVVTPPTEAGEADESN